MSASKPLSKPLSEALSEALDKALSPDRDPLASVTFDERGLVPAIAQDAETGEVLMLAYMNRESLQKTLETGLATYWSRSRQKLWLKGETSGNIQNVLSIHIDCDGDTLLLRVSPAGPVCHTGERTCFYRILSD